MFLNVFGTISFLKQTFLTCTTERIQVDPVDKPPNRTHGISVTGNEQVENNKPLRSKGFSLASDSNGVTLVVSGLGSGADSPSLIPFVAFVVVAFFLSFFLAYYSLLPFLHHTQNKRILHQVE